MPCYTEYGPGPVSSAFPQSLLEIQDSRPCPRPAEPNRLIEAGELSVGSVLRTHRHTCTHAHISHTACEVGLGQLEPFSGSLVPRAGPDIFTFSINMCLVSEQ